MSKGLNKVMLIGNLGQDPELRQAGTNSVLKLRLATNESFKNRDGEWQERTEWHNVEIWGPRGESLSRILRRGSQIYVEGRLQTRSWDAQDGTKRYSTDVVARDIVLLGRATGGGTDAPQHDASPPREDFNDDDIPF